MLNLLGPHAFTTENGAIRELFLERLPIQVQMVLATALTQDKSELAASADKVMEIANQLPLAAAVMPASASRTGRSFLPNQRDTGSTTFPVTDLRDRLDELLVSQELVERRKVSPRTRPHRRSPSRERSPSSECQHYRASHQTAVFALKHVAAFFLGLRRETVPPSASGNEWSWPHPMSPLLRHQ